MEIKEKEIITYEAIIAGALLKFESIDSVDFSLLIEDFQKKNNIEITGLWYSLDNINEYVKNEKNIISLQNFLTLDYFIKEENRTLREKLLDVAGNTVNDYFENLDIKLYQEIKAKELQENKDRILNSANVLLISESNEDYDELIKYGFQNIDHFKSFIRADQYFAKYPERLNKYHIILQAFSSISCYFFGENVELKEKIKNLCFTNHILGISLCKYNLPDHTEFSAYLSDNRNRRNLKTEELSYTAIFDRIMENTLINRTLDNAQVLEQEVEYTDYINPNRLPLPNTKSELKILYLDRFQVNKYAPYIAKYLGLDITFREDNNQSLGKYVKNHLGDYDIIIASDSFSSSLTHMNIESTEQCKDTGRDLTLLVTYKDDLIWQLDENDKLDYQGIGSEINLHYKLAGNLALDSEFHSEEFKVLRKSFEFIQEDDEHQKGYESDVTCIIGILGASLNIYNNVLLQNNKVPIKDLDIKAAEEFDKEYEIADQQEEERKRFALKDINAFDNIRNIVTNYLNYKRKGLITKVPEGLKITEEEKEIKVESIYQGRVLCTITFAKDYKQKNLRIFTIQTISKKGILSNPETIGLYTQKYENFENVPHRPNERQTNALISIQKKIEVTLLPLNDEAWNKYYETIKQKRLARKK